MERDLGISNILAKVSTNITNEDDEKNVLLTDNLVTPGNGNDGSLQNRKRKRDEREIVNTQPLKRIRRNSTPGNGSNNTKPLRRPKKNSIIENNSSQLSLIENIEMQLNNEMLSNNDSDSELDITIDNDKENIRNEIDILLNREYVHDRESVVYDNVMITSMDGQKKYIYMDKEERYINSVCQYIYIFSVVIYSVFEYILDGA